MNRVMMIFAVSLIIISSLLVLTNRWIAAQEPKNDEGVSKKLDDILSTQKMILEKLASVKEELGIIKIRITQAQ